MITNLFRIDDGCEMLISALFVQQGKAIGWVVGLLGPAQFETSYLFFVSALFSGCISLLIIMGADIYRLMHMISSNWQLLWMLDYRAFYIVFFLVFFFYQDPVLFCGDIDSSPPQHLFQGVGVVVGEGGWSYSIFGFGSQPTVSLAYLTHAAVHYNWA